ncbi:hypothetical protein NDU88_005026 [Pleurodeles waltl]|uniref:Uncharacterized protein n=1 Tax=Pleurodeles waltl TaxID=8319 RepID=A0AAV7V6Q5_PLEWA|nr:hypothetical protein NDU88_005026 [Pleurodeles waltl]
MEGPGCPAGAVMGGVREPDPKKGPPTAPRPKKKGPPRSPDPSTAGEKPQGQGGGFTLPVSDTDRETGTPLHKEDRVIREGALEPKDSTIPTKAGAQPRISDNLRSQPETGGQQVPGPSLGAIDGSGTQGQRGEGDRRERRPSGGLHQDTERGEDAESGGEVLEGRGSPGRREALKEGSGTEGQWWERDRGERRDSGGLHQDPERGEDAESGGEMLGGRGSPGRREALKEGSGTEQQSLIPRAGPEGSTQTSPGEKESRRRTRLHPTGKKEE